MRVHLNIRISYFKLKLDGDIKQKRTVANSFEFEDV